jgi:hypothetical protein
VANLPLDQEKHEEAKGIINEKHPPENLPKVKQQQAADLLHVSKRSVTAAKLLVGGATYQIVPQIVAEAPGGGFMEEDRARPKIQALGIVQHPWSLRWQATGHVEGVGWLEARGPTLIDAMAALQAKAEARVAQQGEEHLT